VTEPIFVILSGHCYLVLPNDARAQHIKAMISPYSDEDEQVEMEKWEAKEIKLEFATWDLEWYTDAGKQHPYMSGLYYILNNEVKYVDYDDGNERSLYKQFLDEVFNMCESF
jgi:CRISPR/Cas system CSM-associated protein Csm2 small subunit